MEFMGNLVLSLAASRGRIRPAESFFTGRTALFGGVNAHVRGPNLFRSQLDLRCQREAVMRQSILQELAVRTLQGSMDLEDHLQLELIRAAVREEITLFELIRERLLLKAGAATLGALSTLAERVSERQIADPLPTRSQASRGESPAPRMAA
jgi:hypothetical protein